MEREKTRKLILEFVKQHRLATLSTVASDNKPEAAAIEFGENDNFELIFDCLETSRKYKNLLVNHNVAFVIGWDENVTVQYEGEAHELSGAGLAKHKDEYFRKNPRAKKWENVPGIKYFKVVPKWIRYSDVRKHPWEIREASF